MLPRLLLWKAILSSAIVALTLVGVSVRGAPWIRAGIDTNQPLWGLRGGLQFAIPPGGFGGNGGPRGLIRLGYPTLGQGGYDLINFIAIEPVVDGRRGFSELEASILDGKQGKWFSASNVLSVTRNEMNPGVVSTPAPGVEQLAVTLFVEKFANGAHVRLVLSQRSDAPDELTLAIHAEPDSAKMEQCILTATMGNKARTRLLWLKGGAVSSLELFRDYQGPDFTPHQFFPLTRVPRNAAGDVLVAVTTDEANPANAREGLSRFWRYRGEKVTQYWRSAAADVTDDLRCAVNARFKYWMSSTPVPGGVAYENFELQQSFRDGQRFVFGISQRSPRDLLK